MTERLYNYVKSERGSNVTSEPTVVDCCGRFLLPLDSIHYTDHTDEGIQLVVHGIVKSTNFDDDMVLVIPDDCCFCKHFNKCWIKADQVVRAPTSDYLLDKELTSYFASTNLSAFLQYGVLTKNGHRLG